MFLTRLGLASEDANELAQEAFVRVYERLDHYRGEAEWSYLEVTARHVLFNWLRSKQAAKRQAKFVSFTEGLDDAVASDDTPEAALLEQEAEKAACDERRTQMEHLKSAIQRLPPATGSCLLLALAGYNHSDIAKQLRITPAAVKSRLHDARQKLRSLTNPQGRAEARAVSTAASCQRASAERYVKIAELQRNGSTRAETANGRRRNAA